MEAFLRGNRSTGETKTEDCETVFYVFPFFLLSNVNNLRIIIAYD
jgi:hypothetical protein